MAETDVVVVGAGIAGLTAARELARSGLSVTVVESSAGVGGKVRSHTVAGLELDAGAESFATRGGTVRDLITELGLGGDLVSPNPAGAWLHHSDGRAHPLPRTGILGIPGTPLARDVLDIVGFPGAFRAQMDALLPGFVGAGESRLGPLVRRRMGRKVLDRLVTPIVMGVHSQHPDALEADRVAPGLRAALRKHDSLARAVLALRAAAPAGTSVGGLRGGMHRLAGELHRDVLAHGGQVLVERTVQSVDAAGVTLTTGERINARHAVLDSTPGKVTAGGEADGAAIVLATLVVTSAELDAAPRGTGVLVESGSAVAAKALTHASAKWAWLGAEAGQHRHVLRLSYDSRRTEVADLSAQARADAGLLLGVHLPAEAVQGFARVMWRSAPTSPPAVPDGVVAIGEAAAGTGLAAVIGQARQAAAAILSELAETGSGRGDD